MIANFDAFEKLGLERALVISEEALKAAFHERSAIEHPDQQSESNDDFAQLVQARRILASPAQRLQHWLELSLGDEAPERRGSVDSRLMDLFGDVASCIASADELIAKRENTKSALAKALTENAANQAREQIDNLQSRLSEELQDQIGEFSELESRVLNGQLSEASTAARNLAFLEKWQSQLKERYAKLF